MDDRIKAVEKRRNQIENSEEWTNFKSLIDTVRQYFSPDAANLNTQTSKGSKFNQRRVSDLGISFKNDYTAGVISEMVTSGEQWFEYLARKPEEGMPEMLEAVSAITLDSLNNSNFTGEFDMALGSSCSDGTVCMYVERDLGDNRLRFCTVPFGSFWFVQNYYGEPDTVWVEKTTTAGGLVARFGADNVSEKCRKAAESNPDTEVKIIFYCAPRKKRDASIPDTKNKAYELLTYEKDTSHILEEGGVDLQKFIVYRVKRVNGEMLGRGPCIDTICTMAAIERMSKDIQREASLKTVPFLAVPASGGAKSYKMVFGEDINLMLYNDSFGGHPPQQLVSAADLETGVEVMKWFADMMRSMFYLDYFNPLQDRRNMTLGEAKERIAKSHQMVDKITSPLVHELLNPVLRWAFILLAEGGAFDEAATYNELLKRLGGRVPVIRYKSRLANAQRRIRLASIMETVQSMMFAGQALPEPFLLEYLVQIDWNKLPVEFVRGSNAPETMIRKPSEVKKILAQIAEQQAQAEQVEQAVKLADAASKGSMRPEEGSPTQRRMEGQI